MKKFKVISLLVTLAIMASVVGIGLSSAMADVSSEMDYTVVCDDLGIDELVSYNNLKVQSGGFMRVEFENAQNYGHDVTSTRDCLLSGNSKKSQTRESTEKWAGLRKTVMEAVFGSSIFPDFSDAATITVCERNGRVRGGTQLPCCRRGRSEELCLPHAASTHIRSCMTIQ